MPLDTTPSAQDIAFMEDIAADPETVYLYPLQEKQEAFMDCGAIYQLYGGAKGGGKSYGCRAKCVKSCLSVGNVRGLALRRTMPEIEENMITPMIGELNEGMGGDGFEYNGSKHILTFHNGSTLRFSYCENMKHVLRYQGIQYDFICIEELTQWREQEWRVLMNCLRTINPFIQPFFFGSCNPGGIGHGWVKRLWIDRQFKENENPEQYAFIPATIWDNAVLVDNDPSYLANLQSLPDTLRRAYLHGDWNVFEGQFFNEYQERLTAVQPFQPIGVKRRIIAIDYGRAAPACALWMALTADDRIIVYRELYGTGMSYDQFAARIKALCPADERVDFMVVDPAALDKKSDDTGNSLRGAFRKAGLPTCKGANNARVDGWNAVRRCLTATTDENGREYSRMTICRNCSNLLRTLPEQIHDAIVVEDLDTSGEDHAVDALRYGVMALTSSMSSLASVARLNAMMEKGVDVAALTPKEREYLERGIVDRDNGGNGLLGKEF